MHSAPDQAIGPAFDLLATKLRPPQATGGGNVPRKRLVERLNRSSEARIVILRAGAGYGKTTLLAQWRESIEGRPFAWLSAGPDDNDPVVLLSYIAAALDRSSPIDRSVFGALASPGASIEAKILPRLGAALADIGGPLVLAIDDLHEIHNPRCIDAIVALALHFAPGSQLALSTRDASLLPLGLLRTRRLSLELGPADLSMAATEARQLLGHTHVDVSDDDLADLIRQTEGWPAGLYLAGRAAKPSAGRTRRASAITGRDPFVADFLKSEFLVSLPPDQIRFLTRTSILEQLSGPLCDAVLETTGSAGMLESMKRSNRFVVALDRDRQWYRCHNLVREFLADELRKSDATAVPLLFDRAFDWCEANGQGLAAIRYGQAGGDVDRVVAAMELGVQSAFQSGRAATVEQWFEWLDAHGTPERYPAVAVLGGLLYAVTGRPATSDRWAAIAEEGDRQAPLPDGSPSIDAWRALLRALRSTGGVRVMRENARLAVRTLAPASPWHPASLALLGLSELLSGEPDAADDLFADATENASPLAPDLIPTALAERALIAIAREDWTRASELAGKAVWTARRSRLEDYALNGLAYAVAARVAQQRVRDTSYRELLTQAQRLLPQLTYAVPIISIQTRLELAETYAALADKAGAQTMLREIADILRRCPDLGTLPAQADALRDRLSTLSHDLPGASALTAAELRVLPLLTTHLTFKDVGERLYLSPHTVKSHSMSIYRKLGVTSRGSAVERARELGLI